MSQIDRSKEHFRLHFINVYFYFYIKIHFYSGVFEAYLTESRQYYEILVTRWKYKI
jgi:hypothetical protein